MRRSSPEVPCSWAAMRLPARVCRLRGSAWRSRSTSLQRRSASSTRSSTVAGRRCRSRRRSGPSGSACSSTGTGRRGSSTVKALRIRGREPRVGPRGRTPSPSTSHASRVQTIPVRPNRRKMMTTTEKAAPVLGRPGPAHEPSGADLVSGAQRWVGRVLSTLAVVFLLFDAVGKVARARPAVEGTVQLGYPESTVAGIGLILLACVVLHLIPRTAVLGAILLTGYLGGAVATHVRLLNPLFSHTLFPVYVGVLVWLGLALRDGAVRRLLLGARG